tara:strand:+ start:2751 stop:3239 length:489 start_codon:yes stop_codon:yes gene_type:complete
MQMKYFIGVFFLLFLSSCSGYSIASLGSNIITYSATGKTNSDHAISLVTGKDCKISRALKERNYCQEKPSFFVENETIENLDVASLNIIKNDSDLIIETNIQNKEQENIQLAFVDKVVDSFYYGSLTWAENQLTKGSKVTDRFGLTQDLTEYIEKTFDYYFY